MRKVIYTVSGHIGAGKSRSFHDWYGENPVPATIATPTNKLSNQHHTYFQNEGIQSAVISQDEGYRSASEEYDRRCDEGDDGVLITNHFVALNTSTRTADRLFVSDEIFSPIDTIFIDFECPEDVADFSVIDASAEGYYRLVESQHAVSLTSDVQDKEGTRYRSYGKKARKLGEYILNQHYVVVIDKASFDIAKIEASYVLPDGGKKRVYLQFTIFMLATITDKFADTILIGANFDKSLLAKMWSNEIDFQPHKAIEDRLDYSDLSHKADQLKVWYPPVANLSKTFLARLGDKDVIGGNQKFLDLTAAAIAETFPGKEHIICTNKHPHGNREYAWRLEGKAGGKRVITNPHGWNDLQDYHMAVFLAAINFDPETNRRLFAFYGITAAEAKEALCYELVYQVLGRTSLRSQTCEDEVILVAPDKGAAKFIQQLIGCDDPMPLPMDFGIEIKKRGPAKTVFRSASEEREYQRQKKAAQRARKKAEAAAQPTL